MKISQAGALFIEYDKTNPKKNTIIASKTVLLLFPPTIRWKNLLWNYLRWHPTVSEQNHI